MNRLSALAFSAMLCVTSAYAWEPKPDAALADDEVKEIRIDGVITEDTLKAVREAIKEVEKKDSKIKMLKIGITSPGGDAVAGFTSSRLLRQMSDRKRVKVEIHASGMCASACTWILASGTPGNRFVDRYTITLVHPVQKGNMFGISCVEHKDATKDQGDKMDNAFLELGRDLYMMFTGADKKTVETWLSCGHEIAGQGDSLVALKMADKVED